MEMHTVFIEQDKNQNQLPILLPSLAKVQEGPADATLLGFKPQDTHTHTHSLSFSLSLWAFNTELRLKLCPSLLNLDTELPEV